MDPDLATVFSSLTFKTFKMHLHHFSKIKSNKEVKKQQESSFFLLFLLDDRKIRIRTSGLMDPDPDPEGPKTYGSRSATLLGVQCRVALVEVLLTRS
jgi:hypothetical protein